MSTKSTFLKFGIPLLIVASAVAVVMLLMMTKPDATQKPVQPLAWTVTAEKAKLASHQPLIRLYGQLLSRSPIEISSAIDAQLEKRWVENGEYVTKDQKLLTFDKVPLQLMVDQRQAEIKEIEFLIQDELNRFKTDQELLAKEKDLLHLAENAVNRAKTLEKSEMASGSQLDDARKSALAQQIAIAQRQSAIRNHPTRLSQLQARLSQAKARLGLAKQDLERTEIRSPVNGYIHNVAVNVSEQVSRGKIMISLFDSEQREIRALLPEKYASQIQHALANNQILTGFAEAGSYLAPIVLERISGNIGQGMAGNFVYFKFTSTDENFLLGQTLDITVNLPAVTNSIAIPHDALYGTNTVYKIVDDHLQRTEVEWLGETFTSGRQTRLLIRSADIIENDLILVSKFANASDGLTVKLSTEQL